MRLASHDLMVAPAPNGVVTREERVVRDGHPRGHKAGSGT